MSSLSSSMGTFPWHANRLPHWSGFVIVKWWDWPPGRGSGYLATPVDHERAAPSARETGFGFVSGGMGMLFFAFGQAAGVLVAYSAVGFLEDSAGLIL